MERCALGAITIMPCLFIPVFFSFAGTVLNESSVTRSTRSAIPACFFATPRARAGNLGNSGIHRATDARVPDGSPDNAAHVVVLDPGSGACVSILRPASAVGANSERAEPAQTLSTAPGLHCRFLTADPITSEGAHVFLHRCILYPLVREETVSKAPNKSVPSVLEGT
ncbi:hypothetical protein E4U21_001665 [Claviceps maximensis]|nr:hypothetical protein E4U21_001665 [Claviceps maximensis]